jgi:translation initiation factor eIF-2B subunit delta
MKKKVKVSRYDKLLRDIKALRVQGAENVAKAGIKAYDLKPTTESKKRILALRATEPLLKNSLDYIDSRRFTKVAEERVLKEMRHSHKLAVEAGAELVESGMNIYSHCHSSTVIDILKKAKRQGKKFVVYTTEVEPHLQGRKTAKELAKYNIKVFVSPDLAAEQLIKKCDLFFFGVDAFTRTAVYNKIGTNTLAKIARAHRVKVYSCGISMKFINSVKIEQRKGKEVWDERQKKIEVLYPAFDRTPYTLLTGIISEFGVKKPKSFVSQAKNKLSNLSKILDKKS